jgi:type IV pilus assembly protein PilO
MPNKTIDKLIKIPNSQKIGILLFIMCAMIVAYIYNIFMPQRDFYTVQKENLVKLQAKYNEQQSILSNLPRFKAELKLLQMQFDEALKMLPNDREIPDLITSISTLAQESGLEINLFQPKPEITMDFYAQIPVDMKVSGKYHQIGIFFDKLSKLPRIINIENLSLASIKSKKIKSNLIVLDAAFIAKTFKFIEQTGTSDAGKKKKPAKAKK